MSAKPFKKRTVGTQFIRVASADWVDVKRGRKVEFRTMFANQGSNVPWPMPAVAWRWSRRYGADSCLIVVERAWFEKHGGISDESLRAEGYDTFADYRRAWCARHKEQFAPEKRVMAVRFRPWRDGDEGEFATKMIHHLYGQWL